MTNNVILAGEVVSRDEVIDLGVADDLIAGLRGRLINLEADSPTGYEAVRAGIAEVRTLRTGVDKSRKELKQSALEWGRKVDAEAKRVTDMLLAIEEPLKAKKLAVDEEKERVKREAAEAAQREQEEKLRAEREARETQERQERERVRKEQEIERQRIESERKQLEAERAEQQRKDQEERERLAEERRQIEADRKQLEAAKKKQADEAAAKKAAAERAEQARIREAEEKKRREVERIEAERLAAERKPDKQKLLEFAAYLRGIKSGPFKTSWAAEIYDKANKALSGVAESIEGELK